MKHQVKHGTIEVLPMRRLLQPLSLHPREPDFTFRNQSGTEFGVWFTPNEEVKPDEEVKRGRKSLPDQEVALRQQEVTNVKRSGAHFTGLWKGKVVRCKYLGHWVVKEEEVLDTRREEVVSKCRDYQKITTRHDQVVIDIVQRYRPDGRLVEIGMWNGKVVERDSTSLSTWRVLQRDAIRRRP